MTQTARTVETKFADALAELLYNHGDTDNLVQRMTDFEDSYPSPIRDVNPFPEEFGIEPQYLTTAGVVVKFEDGSVLHLTVTQVKESNR